ncbi:aminotransferase class IV [Embleya sp. NPDC059259]|uniref:aminotransferase class IV n=1 Tax=unclassified Embleya TaxID=2699296 RepID=UPI00368BE7CB
MHQECWRDGRLTALDEVRLSIDSAAMRYAQVVFDGCAAVADATGTRLRILDLGAHLSRFRRSCEGLGFALSWSADELADAVVEVTRRHSGRGAVGIRLFAYAEGEGFLDERPPGVCVFLRPLDGYAPDRPLTLATVDEPRPAHTDLPRWVKATAHYAGARRGLLRARRDGRDDVLFRNEAGRITETSRASLLVLAGDRLISPPVEEGVLPGITRELLGIVAKGALGLTPEHRPLEPAEVTGADGVVLCSSSLGAAVVGAIDEHLLPHEAATALVTAFDRAARGQSPHLDDVVTAVRLTNPAPR